jgi:hypothetical protein
VIDKNWLEQLNFEAVCGGRVEGLAGLGAHWVVFNLRMEDGAAISGQAPKPAGSRSTLAARRLDGDSACPATRYVLKLRRHTLGLHINEIPPFMSKQPEYNLDRLNHKLSKLVGDDTFDTMTFLYDRLYSRVLYITSARTLPGLLLSNTSFDSTETVPFIMHTPPFARRLDEFANWPSDPSDPLSLVPKVNGPESPIQLLLLPHGRVPDWITAAQKAIENCRCVGRPKQCVCLSRSSFVMRASHYALQFLRGHGRRLQRVQHLPEYNKALDAAKIFQNPLVIWGAAAMEGFFRDNEMETVCRFIHARFGRNVVKLKDETFVGQLRALGSLISYYLIEDIGQDGDVAALRRFVRLCNYYGAKFTVALKDGTVIAG